jgi:hypothetical protein
VLCAWLGGCVGDAGWCLAATVGGLMRCRMVLGCCHWKKDVVQVDAVHAWREVMR